MICYGTVHSLLSSHTQHTGPHLCAPDFIRHHYIGRALGALGGVTFTLNVDHRDRCGKRQKTRATGEIRIYTVSATVVAYDGSLC